VHNVQTLILHADAPPKPEHGQPCNGCGICCIAERCPVALLVLPGGRGSCAALEWDGPAGRYFCGMVRRPANYIAWLPRSWEGAAGRWFAVRIAAGKACDFDATEIGDTLLAAANPGPGDNVRRKELL
jgi:hypothetical protein